MDYPETLNLPLSSSHRVDTEAARLPGEERLVSALNEDEETLARI